MVDWDGRNESLPFYRKRRGPLRSQESQITVLPTQKPATNLCRLPSVGIPKPLQSENFGFAFPASPVVCTPGPPLQPFTALQEEVLAAEFQRLFRQYY